MIQLAYTSLAPESLGSGDVFKIVERSAQNNGPAQLTGFLIYANGRFFQVIEGPLSGVDGLVRKLKTDPRHHTIKVVHHSSIAKRSFPTWRMKRIIVQEADARLETLLPELVGAPDRIRRVVDRFLGLALA